MEYLMTYGWAILIIAVVLAALFELGVFNGSNLAPQACIAQAGFVCKNPIYTANGIGITLGQTTGREYFDSFMFIAAEGEPLSGTGIPQNFTNPSNGLFIGNLLPGQTVGADFNSSKFAYGQIPANAPIGTPFAGYVWLGYCLSPCSVPTAYSKVATITAKEAGTSSASFGGYFGGGSGSSAPPPSGPQVGNVIFTANPLPTDTPWSVTYNGVMESANTPSNIVFTSIPTDVSLPYTINAPIVTPSACYSTNSISGIASGGQTVPVQFSQVPCYVPITLSPGSTISGTFQQNITFNPSTYSAYESGDLGNIRFYSSMSGNVPSGPLDSWLEGCPETACTPSSSHAIFWVKLPNGETQTAPGNTIYMVFGNTIGAGSQFDGVVAGEAPQLSCLTPGPGCTPYATYDNGANVFPTFYQNFAGGSLPGGWNCYGCSNFGYSVQNGITLTSSCGCAQGTLQYSSTPYNPQTSILDFYGALETQGCMEEGAGELGNNGPCGGPAAIGIMTDTNSNYYMLRSAGDGEPTFSYSLGSTLVMMSMWEDPSTVYGEINYGDLVTTGNQGASTSLYVGWNIAERNVPTSQMYAQYARVRAYPPGGNMPGAMLGPVQ